MRLLLLAGSLLLATLPSAQASTLGYLPCTPAAHSWTIATPSGAPRTIVARTTEEWRAAWRAAGGAGDAPAVAFDRDMVIGVVSAKPERVVYRVQLDDASAPKALEVHLGSPDAPCGFERRTPAPTRAHFVATPRSSLAVHFVFDGMIDGRVYVTDPSTEGVSTVEVATVPAIQKPATKLRALDREEAEQAVIRRLTPAQRAKLAIGPIGRTLARVPHGWTRLVVERSDTSWRVRYDDLAFDVDVATGTATLRK